MNWDLTDGIVSRNGRVAMKVLRDFLDIFNHRLISLFYQAWEKYRFGASYERGQRDAVSQRLMDLVGLGTSGLTQQQDVRDESLLFYSGLLSHRPRSAAGLEQMLADYFQIPVEAQQFAGWCTPVINMMTGDCMTRGEIGICVQWVSRTSGIVQSCAAAPFKR